MSLITRFMLRQKALQVNYARAGITAFALAVLTSLAGAATAFAHGVPETDQAMIEQNVGTRVFTFMYLGAKHMVTGYDHLLFLAGVIFFLYRMKDVLHYVTLFTIGHSITLIFGVLLDINANAYLVDAIIGLSVVYKALDNMGAFKRVLGFSVNQKAAVTAFGLFHGFGLATAFQELQLAREGLLANILSFNVGVEIGQVLALSAILILMNLWRRYPSFKRQAFNANAALMSAGFILTGYQIAGFFAAQGS